LIILQAAAALKLPPFLHAALASIAQKGTAGGNTEQADAPPPLQSRPRTSLTPVLHKKQPRPAVSDTSSTERLVVLIGLQVIVSGKRNSVPSGFLSLQDRMFQKMSPSSLVEMFPIPTMSREKNIDVDNATITISPHLSECTVEVGYLGK